MKGGLGFGLEILARGLRQVGGGDGDFQEREHRRDGSDGGDIEVGPAAQVADVPPEVRVDASRCAGDATDESRGGVGCGEVVEEGGGGDGFEVVEANVGREGVLNGLDSWGWVEFREVEVVGGSCSIRDVLDTRKGGGREGSYKVQGGLRCA